jgi:hypothetical protein
MSGGNMDLLKPVLRTLSISLLADVQKGGKERGDPLATSRGFILIMKTI